MASNGLVIWMTGLSGSGKSTIAHQLFDKLKHQEIHAVILDGDVLRNGVSSDLGFSAKDREENIRRAAEIAKLLSSSGMIVICSLITPLQRFRELAKKIIGDDYFEVYIQASLESCEKRDVKGWYAKARSGQVTNFTGISSEFETPSNPDLVINTDVQTEAAAVENLMAAVSGRIYL